MKQVKYFEGMYKGKPIQHYVRDTEDYKNWVLMMAESDPDAKVTYIACDDGSTITINL